MGNVIVHRLLFTRCTKNTTRRVQNDDIYRSSATRPSGPVSPQKPCKLQQRCLSSLPPAARCRRKQPLRQRWRLPLRRAADIASHTCPTNANICEHGLPQTQQHNRLCDRHPTSGCGSTTPQFNPLGRRTCRNAIPCSSLGTFLHTLLTQNFLPYTPKHARKTKPIGWTCFHPRG